VLVFMVIMMSARRIFVSGPRNDAHTYPPRQDDDVGRRAFASWSCARSHSLRGVLHLKDNNRDHI
jgi:hypothetical protein